MPLVSDPMRARRLARVLVSDIVAYAGDRVRMGLEKDDIFVRLGPDIERARAFYDRHVDSALVEKDRLFNFALVDVLIAGNRKVATSIW